MRRLIVILLLCGSACGQTITVNSSITHQTWRAYTTGALRDFYDGLWPNGSTTACNGSTILYTMGSSTWNQVTSLLASDLGSTGFSFGVNQQQGWDQPSDVSTIANSTWVGGGGQTCRTRVHDWSTSLTPLRNSIVASGVTPYTYLGWYAYSSGVGTMPTSPANWQSTPDNAAAEVEAVLQYINTTQGWYPSFTTINEPCAGSGGVGCSFFGTPGGGIASNWLANFYNSLYTRVIADSVPTRMAFPTPSPGSSTITQLNSMDAVSGIESKIGEIAYHCYSCPSTTDATLGMPAIATRAQSDNAISAMTEFGPGGDNGYTNAINIVTNQLIPNINIANVSVFDNGTLVDVCQSSPCSNTDTLGTGNHPGIGIDPTPTGTSCGTNQCTMNTFVVFPLYYVFRQLFHYIKPGYIRVDSSSSSGSVLTTAFKRPTDGGLVVVAINNNTSVTTVTVSGLANVPTAVYALDPSMCGTTGQFRCTPANPLIMIPSSGSLTLNSMPVSAVWTLVQSTVDGPSALPCSTGACTGYITTVQPPFPDTTGYTVKTVGFSGAYDFTGNTGLQNAVTFAASNCGSTGMVIKVHAGDTFTNNNQFPANNCTGGKWIIVESDDCGNSGVCSHLPAYGTRIDNTSATTTYMPIFIPTSVNKPAIFIGPSTSNYWLLGLRFRPNSGLTGFTGDFAIVLGETFSGSWYSTQTTFAQIPFNLIIDRVLVQGMDQISGDSFDVNTGRGIRNNCNSCAVINSWVERIHTTDGSETQNISGWNGAGPVLIDNNTLLGPSSETVSPGGGSSNSIPNLITSDVTITRNYMSKQASLYRSTIWDADGTEPKNFVEQKIGQRILVEGNIYQDNWNENNQQGRVFAWTPRCCPGGTCDCTTGGSPWAVLQDVTCRYNVGSNLGQVYEVAGFDSQESTSATDYGQQRGQRFSLHDNLWTNVSRANADHGNWILAGWKANTVYLRHDTVFPDPADDQGAIIFNPTSTFPAFSGPFVVTDNLVGNKANAFGGSPGTCSGGENCFTVNADALWTISNNVLAGETSTTWPTNTTTCNNSGISPTNTGCYQAITGWGMTNSTNCNLSTYNTGMNTACALTTGSPFHNKSSDAVPRDIGADMNAIASHTANVLIGNPSPLVTAPATGLFAQK